VKLALLGAGLLGGSTVGAWRRADPTIESVLGFDPDAAALREGVARGLLDQACGDLASAVQGADIVVLACPVGAMPALLRELARAAPAGAILTDVGSTKAGIVEAARQALGPTFPRFVPGHPIAGGERPGISSADASLFEGRRVVTTPVRETDGAALERVEALWRASGATVERLDPAEHDRIFAAVSHLPHVLAFALVHMLCDGPGGEGLLRYAGAGFADFTRIAASDPTMWRDIALANRGPLAANLREFRTALEALEAALEAGDGEAILRAFARASGARRAHSFPRGSE
jgi:prephenate dehydrogenase